MSQLVLREAAPRAGGRAGRREWLGLAAIALPCMLYSMDLTVIDLALPALSQALRPTSAELLWIVDIYGFLLAGSLITMGMLGDRIGRRRLLLMGAAGFGVASILGAFATSAGSLIAARGLLGVAGATIAPSTLSLIRSLFEDARERTFAIGVWATSFSTGAAIGPLVGGLLLQRFYWGSAFLIGVPVVVVLLLVGPVLLPEFRSEQRSSIDWLSSLLSVLGVLPIIYGIKQAALGGSLASSSACVLAGVVACLAFLRRQRALAEPMFDLALLRNAEFATSLAVNTLTLFVTFATFVFLAQFMQQVLGLPVLYAGLYTVPAAGGFIVGSQLAPQLVKRFPVARVIAASLVVAALGLGVLARLGSESTIGWVIAGSVLLALGASPAVTLVTDLVVGHVPPDRAGAASALSETCGELGGALGIAILGTVGSAGYRSSMAASRSVAVPEQALDTLSGALTVARGMSGRDGSLLVAQARAAFVGGMHEAMLVAVVVAMASAVLVYARLGRSPRVGPAEALTGADEIDCTR
jgi:DHA2 family multidrug resistance protein-like MFS transporter